MNRFGEQFSFSTFGESHGKAIGCIVDGVPAGLSIDLAFIQSELDRRKPGQNSFATARKEDDKVEILSGVFDGKSTGTPIAMVIFNTNQKSRDYENIKSIFRPGHADFTYFHKYGIRDYRGGGRASARETAARVCAGAVAKLLCQELGIHITSGISAIGTLHSDEEDYDFAKTSEIYSLSPTLEAAQKALILQTKQAHDSIGGSAKIRITQLPIGLGEPLYYRLDAKLADAMMGINAVKAIEIGDGAAAATTVGSSNNDQMNDEGFMSNHAGGILGGISNAEPIELTVHFKPTPSIFKKQSTTTTQNETQAFELKGRHDPCVAIRGSIVCESMAALVIADMLLLNMGRTLHGVKHYYQ